MTVRVLAALALCALPIAANAQIEQFYSPPKVIKQGTHTSPIVGAGVVKLKVLVRKNGTPGPVSVSSSTNHADDAAAMEIAKTSTYKPGERDAKPEEAYYTFNLKFNGSEASFFEEGGASSSGLSQADALLHAGKYPEAKTALSAYLVSHPNDSQGEALLGVTDEYMGDAAGAATAFDAAGPSGTAKFQSVAVKAYNDAAAGAIKAQNYAAAVGYANKANALTPSVNGLYLQGTAEASNQQYAQAVTDLQKARSMSKDATTNNVIDSTLVTAYLLNGQSQQGLALADQVKQRDPSMTGRVNDSIAAYYLQQASAESKTAKSNDDWKKVKATADQALAVAPNNPQALYVQGIALANSGSLADAKTALLKAKANAGSDAALSAQIDTQLAALAKLGQK